jgi:uridine phosphorylase
METAGIYGLGKVLGHECISINALIANRALGVFSPDPKEIVDRMIEDVLDLITASLPI